jgi:hypothetical protein
MALILATSTSNASRTHPHLLPLHIKYSGPSPVPVYFVVHDEDDAFSSNQQRATRSVFRGRAMHGVRMGLPDGYGGAVLRVDNVPIVARGSEASCRKRKLTTDELNDEGRCHTKAPRPSRARGASAEASKASKSRQVDSETSLAPQIAEVEVLENPPGDVESSRITRPIAHFNTLSLWNPDNPIDGRDEYIRGINEWTRLAGVVSLLTT